MGHGQKSLRPDEGVREKSRRSPWFLVWIPEWIAMPLPKTGKRGGGLPSSSPHLDAGKPRWQPLSTIFQQPQSILILFGKDEGHIVIAAASSREYTTNKGPLEIGNTQRNLGTRKSRQDKGISNTSSREIKGCEKPCPYSKSWQGTITLGNPSKLSEKSTARVFCLLGLGFWVLLFFFFP